MNCYFWVAQAEVTKEKTMKNTQVCHIHLYFTKHLFRVERLFKNMQISCFTICIAMTLPKTRRNTNELPPSSSYRLAVAASPTSRKKLQTMNLWDQLWCGSTSQIIDYLGNVYLSENDFNTQSHVMTQSHTCTEVRSNLSLLCCSAMRFFVK